MSTRRPRQARALLYAAAVALAVLAVRAPSLAFLVAVGAVLWRLERQRRREVAARRPAAAPPSSPGATPDPRKVSSLADARARRNGWAPPARPRMVPVMLSAECAGGDCAGCPGAGCGCPCGHDSRVIVAMNTARADAEAVPF